VNLSQRLNNIRVKFETGDTPPEIVDVLNDHVQYLLDSNVEKNALTVGDSVPMELQVHTETGTKRLSDLIGDRFLVLTWFRGNW
jgi:hypothetical protein